MSDTKISDDPSATTLVGDELLAGVQGGANVSITPAQIATYLDLGTVAGLDVDVDGTGAANSDALVMSQKAVRTLVAANVGSITDAMVLKGATDCSANPNYPAADAGDLYRVSVAGRIGGGSGPKVEAGDAFYCVTDAASAGNHATVGANWIIQQGNIDGAATATTAPTNHGVVLGKGTQDLGATAAMTDGQLLVGQSGADPLPKTLSGDATLSAAGALTVKPPECICVAMSDETTALTTGTKVTMRMPYAFTLTAVRASVTTAPTGATLLGIDIKESGTTIFSTKPTFDASEKTTTTAATANVLSDTSLADDAEMTFIVDAVGSTIAGAGLKAYLIGHRT